MSKPNKKDLTSSEEIEKMEIDITQHQPEVKWPEEQYEGIDAEFYNQLIDINLFKEECALVIAEGLHWAAITQAMEPNKEICPNQLKMVVEDICNTICRRYNLAKGWIMQDNIVDLYDMASDDTESNSSSSE